VSSRVELSGYSGITVVSLSVGDSVDAIHHRVAEALQEVANNITLSCLPCADLFDDIVDAGTLFPLPVLSVQPITAIIMTGATIALRAELPAPLVYAEIAGRMGCAADEIKLIYSCDAGCISHSLGNACSIEGPVTVVATAKPTVASTTAPMWMPAVV
jgi:hypothetical protein